VQNNWLKELNKVIWLLVICFTLGLLLGAIWRMLALGCLLYLGWMLFQLKRIHEWLAGDGNNDPPTASGIWGEVCDKIYYLQKKQKRIQAKLESDVAYLHDSFASLNEAVVLLHENGTIDWCNDAAKRNLGFHFPKDEGQYLPNLLRDPAFIKYYESSDYSEGIEIPCPINNDRCLLVQITQFGNGNRLLFARDITELHKLEEMRRDFVSNVSHELRTPLTVISGYIDNFSAFVPQLPKLEKPLQQMEQHARRMESLLRDLLELSRLETLPHEMHKTRVSLSSLAVMVVEEAKASIPVVLHRDIKLDVQGEVKIFGQETELHSALLNLVVNACKYTLEGGKIDVRCWQDAYGAHFSVTDDGIGIDPLQIPRLTERFYRVDKSRSINTGGTGLGLAIVKRVLQRHEAELVITSAPGKGSCFTCHFPVHRVAG
jgi:two-component system, OmpR family, phosphate regulon sensor histidine kinase PhoR